MVLSDSMLSRLSTYHKDYLKDALGVDSLKINAFPGKTATYILDPGSWIYNEILYNNYKAILISVCQNDISQTIEFGSVEEVSSMVYKKTSEYIKTFTRKFPATSFVFLPLTLRAVCSKKYTRFPQSRKPEYISKVNEVIQILSKQFNILAKENDNFYSVEGNFLWRDSASLLVEDGIHLSTYGLDKYLTESMSVVRPWIGKR